MLSVRATIIYKNFEIFLVSVLCSTHAKLDWPCNPLIFLEEWKVIMGPDTTGNPHLTYYYSYIRRGIHIPHICIIFLYKRGVSTFHILFSYIRDRYQHSTYYILI